MSERMSLEKLNKPIVQNPEPTAVELFQEIDVLDQLTTSKVQFIERAFRTYNTETLEKIVEIMNAITKTGKGLNAFTEEGNWEQLKELLDSYIEHWRALKSQKGRFMRSQRRDDFQAWEKMLKSILPELKSFNDNHPNDIITAIYEEVSTKEITL